MYVCVYVIASTTGREYGAVYLLTRNSIYSNSLENVHIVTENVCVVMYICVYVIVSLTGRECGAVYLLIKKCHHYICMRICMCICSSFYDW